MCTSFYITYTCGCKKETEFVQCTDRAGTNVKCNPIKKEPGKQSANYCKGHLVKPDAPKKYFSDEDLQDWTARFRIWKAVYLRNEYFCLRPQNHKLYGYCRNWLAVIPFSRSAYAWRWGLELGRAIGYTNHISNSSGEDNNLPAESAYLYISPESPVEHINDRCMGVFIIVISYLIHCSFENFIYKPYDREVKEER